jgi:hypothetical protein
MCRHQWDTDVTAVAASDPHGVLHDNEFRRILISVVTYRRRVLMADLGGSWRTCLVSFLEIDTTNDICLIGAASARPCVRMDGLARSFAREASSF